MCVCGFCIGKVKNKCVLHWRADGGLLLDVYWGLSGDINDCHKLMHVTMHCQYEVRNENVRFRLNNEFVWSNGSNENSPLDFICM